MQFEQVLELVKAVSDSNLTTFEYKNGDIKLLMKTGEQEILEPVVVQKPAVSIVPVVEENILKEEKITGNIVESPLVGTFYAAPAEDSPAFVKIGDTVKRGQTLAIVEAMKLMNEIESDFDGVVKEILVGNGQGVEYKQPLFVIE